YRVATLPGKLRILLSHVLAKKINLCILNERKFCHLVLESLFSFCHLQLKKNLGYETAFCKDTSDTNDEDVWYVRQASDHDLHAGDIVAVEETFDVEYEVESDDSSLCSDQGENDSYSDEEKYVKETLKTVITYICRTDSDIEFWADDSSSENECFDVEISESDQWRCNKCGQLNKPPLRYCLKCWDERKGWLRDKDKQRPPQRKRSKEKAKGCAKKKNVLTEESSIWNSDCDSPSTSGNIKDSSGYDSLSTKDSQNSGSSQEKFDDQIPVEKSIELCLICCSKPANASIIHGNIGHVICCYKCALKLKRRNKRCPVCRRTIDKVVYQVCSV
ncbi:E3 ubiquitin-protein ligase Mdm2-like, partial [Stegodyphus dumicola]|uniref:E3 ubiquitin-protein ligase Mdm2-like n=1 Tax=Stegodyphus dumicola TaxID=202533 RepID=UPI0015A894C1